MGRQAQAKRARREQAEYAAALTTCEGTWLEKRPDVVEQQRIELSVRALRSQMELINQFKTDEQTANLYSLELFREPLFTPLHLEDWVIEQIIAAVGEPPLVDNQDDPQFATYLQQAVLSVATARMRSALAGQLRRFMPQFVASGKFKEAIAVDYNAFRTSLGNEVSPFLVQMTLQGLARWYDEHDDEAEEDATDETDATEAQVPVDE